jgi:chromosome segregation ATPase
MSDSNDRLREKTLQIASLNQKMEVMQAQLSGSQKRAYQLGQQVEELEGVIARKDDEIRILQSELNRTKDALESVGQQMRNIRSEETESLAKRKPAGRDYTLDETLEATKRKVTMLREDLRKLSSAAMALLNDEDGARDLLREMVMQVGDPKYKVLSLVLEKKKLSIEEIAAVIVADMSETLEIIDELQNADEIEVQDGQMVVPSKKYRVAKIPLEEWKISDPVQIFDDLEEIIGKTEGHENIAEAVEKAVDFLEQKLARGGALIFEMRRTANKWKAGPADSEGLKYKIKEWKSRALALG